MAFYVSPDGSDGNSGESWAQALRTLTRAMDLAAGSVSEVVHVAAGTYNRAAGEGFPVIVPRNVDVQGEGPELSILEYSFATDPLCGTANIIVDLRGTLSGMGIVNVDFDPDTMHPITSIGIAGLDPDAVIDDVSTGTVAIWSAASVSNVLLTGMMYTLGFEQSGFPLIEGCTVASEALRYGGFCLEGGRMERCSTGYLWVVSPSDTVVRDNNIVDIHVVVHRPAAIPAPRDSDPIPQFIDNTFGAADEDTYLDLASQRTNVWINGESYWEGNVIAVRRMVIACTSTFVDNPLLSAFQIGILRPQSMSTMPNPRDDMHDVNPRFHGNVFQQPPVPWSYIPGRYLAPGWEVPEEPYLVAIGANARPVFEENEFLMTASDPWMPVRIEEQGNPDFGGGHSASSGENTFDTGPLHPHHHLQVDIGPNTLTLHARNNRWRFDPSVNVVSGDVTIHVDDATVI
jgi:hypothetical protein